MAFWTTRTIDLNAVWRRGLARSRWALLALCLIAQPSFVFAQSDLVVDPRLLEFTPSPDHANILRYELEILPESGNGVPLAVLNLGRPTPSSTGQIRLDLSQWALDQSLPAGTYRARVTAIADGGVTPSTASNPFTFSLACTYSLSSTSASYAAAGGNGSVNITGSVGCNWTSSSSVSWITVAGSGSGNGSATFAVQANATATPRTGTLTIAGQTFTVTQAGAGGAAVTPPPPSTCRTDLSAGSESVPASGADNWSVRLTTTSSCAWTATSPVNWITINTASGTGSGPVRYTVAPNTGAARSSGLAIGGWTFVINQGAGSGASTSCSFALSTSSQSVAAAGGSNSVSVTTSGGCAWTASSPASWITLGSTSGNGSGTLNYTVAANTAATSRNATLTIAGRSLAISQAAAASTACSYSITPTTRSVAATASTNSVSVTTAAGCAWTAAEASDWITLGSSNGTGAGSLSYTVAANTSTSPRTGTITVAGQTHTVSQSAGTAPAPNPAPAPAPTTCPIKLQPGFVQMRKEASSMQIIVQYEGAAGSRCSWTTSESSPWVTVTSGSGTNNGFVSFSVTTNNTGQTRTAQLSIGGETLTISQKK